MSGGTDLLGKTANELAEGVSIKSTEITGTLHYVSEYVGFHGSDPEQQEGNYLPLQIDLGKTSDAEVTIELTESTKGPVKLDPDMLFVGRITNKDTQKIIVKATKNKTTKELTYTLSNLVLEEKA